MELPGHAGQVAEEYKLLFPFSILVIAFHWQAEIDEAAAAAGQCAYRRVDDFGVGHVGFHHRQKVIEDVVLLGKALAAEHGEHGVEPVSYTHL